MPQLSEPAKKLIEEFERKIETISPEERDAILKRMTSHILALNEDVRGLFQTLQKDKARREGEILNARGVPGEEDLENIRDYI
ncbi:MAG: hypothetical protein WCT45_02635 [Candidatus Paceibacterota bacterium]|jgi:hypothetical protein